MSRPIARTAVRFALALPLLLLPLGARAGVVYQLTDLGALPGGSDSIAFGVNNSGQVVGWSSGAGIGTRPFLWSGGVMTDLGTLGPDDNYAYAFAVNDLGQAVGRQGLYAGVARSVLWQSGTISTLNPLPGDDASQADGVNNKGQVVGLSTGTAGGKAVMWDSGNPTALNGLTEGHAVNDAGQVAGTGQSAQGRGHPFLWQNGVATDLGDFLGGAGFGDALAINGNGQVVGYAQAAVGAQAFLWQGGVMTDLGSLGGGQYQSAARAVNGWGEAAGYSFTLNAQGLAEQHAVVWGPQGGVLDLNAALDGSGAGWRLVDAYGVNDAGQVVGYGVDAAGDQHAFLVTPVPAPSTAALAGLGAVTLLLRWAWMRARRVPTRCCRSHPPSAPDQSS